MKTIIAVVDKEDWNGYLVEVELSDEDWDKNSDIMEVVVERGVVKEEVDTVLCCDGEVFEKLKEKFKEKKK